MLLPELEREAIISQRLEEKQRVLDKVNVSMLLKTHRKRPESPETETVSSAAKRK
jgi:RNA polymerase-associated protein RTF1